LCGICKAHPDWVEKDQELRKWWDKHRKSNGHEHD
jgi:hypothetical protein